MKIYVFCVCCFLVASTSFAQQDPINNAPSFSPQGFPTILYKPESPLFIVDGLMMLKKDSITNQKLMITLDPSKIESIEVIKTNTAILLYGEVAKNGVVAVTTKEFANKFNIQKE